MCGFIKEWIENWKEDKKRNSEIENPGNMSDLLKIVAMKDPKYVKEFIEYNEEINTKVVEYKENIWSRMIKFIKKLWHRN